MPHNSLSLCKPGTQLLFLRQENVNIDQWSIHMVCDNPPTVRSIGEKTEKFYCTLTNAKVQYKLQQITIVMGGLDAKVG